MLAASNEYRTLCRRVWPGCALAICGARVRDRFGSPSIFNVRGENMMAVTRVDSPGQPSQSKKTVYETFVICICAFATAALQRLLRVSRIRNQDGGQGPGLPCSDVGGHVHLLLWLGSYARRRVCATGKLFGNDTQSAYPANYQGRLNWRNLRVEVVQPLLPVRGCVSFHMLRGCRNVGEHFVRDDSNDRSLTI